MSNARVTVRRSAAEWSLLVQACERSGLSRREFAKREGLHYGTFGFWASRLGAKQASSKSLAATPSFIRVRVAEQCQDGTELTKPACKTPSSDDIEVVLANGRRFRCQLSQAEDPRLPMLLAVVEGGR